jgi:hypothetical protein
LCSFSPALTGGAGVHAFPLPTGQIINYKPQSKSAFCIQKWRFLEIIFSTSLTPAIP